MLTSPRDREGRPNPIGRPVPWLAMSEPRRSEAPSPLEAALDRVGDRWSLLVVESLLDGPRRFGELGEVLPGIAANILTDRLRRLERENIVVATPYQHRPTRMAYALTADGHDLASALRLLADWGSRRTGGAEPLRHELCGTPLEARWYCPTCTVSVDDADAPEVRTV
jgi:DNA-binding HxlR family transcriptional regulator